MDSGAKSSLICFLTLGKLLFLTLASSSVTWGWECFEVVLGRWDQLRRRSEQCETPARAQWPGGDAVIYCWGLWEMMTLVPLLTVSVNTAANSWLVTLVGGHPEACPGGTWFLADAAPVCAFTSGPWLPRTTDARSGKPGAQNHLAGVLYKAAVQSLHATHR